MKDGIILLGRKYNYSATSSWKLIYAAIISHENA